MTQRLPRVGSHPSGPIIVWALFWNPPDPPRSLGGYENMTRRDPVLDFGLGTLDLGLFQRFRARRRALPMTITSLAPIATALSSGLNIPSAANGTNAAL